VVSYIEFPSFLFGAIWVVRLLHIPYFAAMVLVAKSIIINNEVIVAASILPLVVLVSINLFKYTLRIFYLSPKYKNVNLVNLFRQKPIEPTRQIKTLAFAVTCDQLTSYWSVLLTLPSLASLSF